MPGRCSCAGSSCSCSVVQGNGITVTGTGSNDNPFVISQAASQATISVDVAGALDLSAYTGIASVLVTLNANATSLVLPTQGTIELVILQGTGGSRTITWPASIKFPGGTDPVLSTVVGRYDWVRLVYAGNVWVGQLVGTNLS